MAKFVYRMQNILNIKQKLETQAKMTYSLANQKYLEQQKILQEYMVRRVGYEQHWKKLMQGNLNLQEVEHARADVNAMKTIVRRQMVEVHKAEKELEDARNRLKTVMQPHRKAVVQKKPQKKTAQRVRIRQKIKIRSSKLPMKRHLKNLSRNLQKQKRKKSMNL